MRCEEEREYPVKRGVSRFKVWIQGMWKHEMFREPNCMLFYLCIIFYHMVERLSPIRGCRNG